MAYMAETHHPLDNQVLAIFPPSATIPLTLHYSECPVYDRFFFFLAFSTIWYTFVLSTFYEYDHLFSLSSTTSSSVPKP